MISFSAVASAKRLFTSSHCRLVLWSSKRAFSRRLAFCDAESASDHHGLPKLTSFRSVANRATSIASASWLDAARTRLLSASETASSTDCQKSPARIGSLPVEVASFEALKCERGVSSPLRLLMSCRISSMRSCAALVCQDVVQHGSRA
jgi:hypothetical protein